MQTQKMPTHKYIIAYDICCTKRLAKVHRYLKTQALFIQKSVYYWQGTHEELTQLKSELENRMNITEDDIRGYRLKNTQILHFLARSPFLEHSYFEGYPQYQHHPKDDDKNWECLHEII